MSNVWELVKNGDYEQACLVADEEFKQTSSVLPLRNKVFALLRLKQFADAAALCDRIIAKQHGDTDSDFAFLGTSHWLDGRPDQAIAAWRAATNTTYTDAAGGVEIGLLLLYASLRRSDESLRQEAESQLSRLSKQPEIKNWPGSIAPFVLHKCGESDLLSTLSAQPVLRAKQLCQADFYIGLRRLAEGDKRGWIEQLVQSTSHGAICLMKQEFYLADGELRERAI